ncbi:hypothetical protein [Noviherbaspirillum cavernae]|uniref:hypothetical protein n=1 Tax=Noviherbaspirillum cavernae TaxID=2320862 RepID=UPI0011C3A691|nr:hypothetical protein [Noviherbaspirillum cavernae]
MAWRFSGLMNRNKFRIGADNAELPVCCQIGNHGVSRTLLHLRKARALMKCPHANHQSASNNGFLARTNLIIEAVAAEVRGDS